MAGMQFLDVDLLGAVLACISDVKCLAVCACVSRLWRAAARACCALPAGGAT